MRFAGALAPLDGNAFNPSEGAGISEKVFHQENVFSKKRNMMKFA